MDNLGILMFVILICILVIKRNFKFYEDSKGKTRKEVYYEYLKSRRWKIKRNRALKRAGYKCQVCACTKNLQVHHNTYKHIFHEHKTDLVVLCRKCHTTFHNK